MNISCCKSYVGKQIIGLLPSQADCLFYYTPNVDAFEWTINGFYNDNYIDINASLNPYGIYYYLINADYGQNFILSYVGSSEPTEFIDIRDSSGNPQPISSWSSCCNKKCFEATLDSNILHFDFGNGIIIYSSGLPNGNFEWELIFKAVYGQQAIITWDLSIPNKLTIDNAFICGIPSFTIDDITYTDMVPCGYVPPPAPKCYWFAEYFSAPDHTFDLWTINGNPFNTEIYNITGDASNSLTPNGTILAFDSRFPWIVTDDPLSLPTIPTALDSLGNPFTASWQQGGCDLVCWELIVPKTDLLFGSVFIGIPIINFILDTAFFGNIFNISNATQISQLESLYQSMFGPQATITSNIDSNGDYIIRINNTYESFPPQWINGTLGGLTFIQIPC